MRYLSREHLSIILLIILFIAIRSIHFSQQLNFSADQGMTSLEALKVFRAKEITLIGTPVTSIELQGRQIFYGSIYTYLQLFFLLLGHLDPIKASYMFVLFAALSVIPLYYGTKLFTKSKTAAYLITTIYTLFPFYIDYTSFLWNPNYQLALTPYLILLMGFYRKYQRRYLLVLIGIVSGILLPLHYLFAFIILGLFIYYLKTAKYKNSLIFIFGAIFGLLPMIIFELRNNFYNTQTLIIYLTHLDELAMIKGNSVFQTPHYYLVCSFLLLFLIINLFRSKISYKVNAVIFAILLTLSLCIYIPTPSHAFGMAENWNYLDEDKVYQVIKSKNLPQYNMVNLEYNTMYWVQRYLSYRDNLDNIYQDFDNNKYLFVVNRDDQYMKNWAYEVNRFVPSRQIEVWKINNTYNLYLLERLPQR